jgi:hypothetical protein
MLVVLFFDRLMDFLRKCSEKLEAMHDYGAIVLVGGRCRADYGFVEICGFRIILIVWLVDIEKFRLFLPHEPPPHSHTRTGLRPEGSHGRVARIERDS